MKLQLAAGVKPDFEMEKEKEVNSKKMEDEQSLVSSVLPEEKPHTSSSKIITVTKNIAHTLLEKKKENCLLLPQNCSRRTKKCCMSKLAKARHIKEELAPKEATA